MRVNDTESMPRADIKIHPLIDFIHTLVFVPLQTLYLPVRGFASVRTHLTEPRAHGHG